MKLNILSVYMVLLVLPIFTAAQGVIISTGLYVKMSGGTLVLHGDWVNNGSWADTNSRIVFNDTVQQHIGGSSFTEFDDMTINNVKGVIGNNDFTIEGVLNLQSANASDTVGTLDMGSNTLTMDSSATTVGMGDVTGVVRRLRFATYKAYSFGNQFSTVSFNPGGTYPSKIDVKISIGKAPLWKPDAIKRIYDLVQTGASNCLATVTTHYLDSELNGNTEHEMVLWANGISGMIMGLNEFGRANYNTVNEWVAISSIHIGYFPAEFGQLEITLANTAAPMYEWNGSQSTTWSILENWTPNGYPSKISRVTIPDAFTTTFSPTLPDTAEVKTLAIETNGILNSGNNSKLYIYGNGDAWNDQGTFNSSMGIVIFKGDLATIAGTTNFYNVTIDSLASLRVTAGNIMRIAGSMNNKGTWHALIADPTTVEYNGGNQTVVVPNPLTNRYSTLILSGSGTKTMPVTALSIFGDFTMAGTATAIAAASLNTKGNFNVGSGATFNTGALNHSIGGNFSNNGTFTATGSTITCNGSMPQTIGGTSATTFNSLTSNNAADVTITSDALTTVSGILTINTGKQFSVAPGKLLSVDGTITNNAGASNFVLHSGAGGTASLLHNNDNVPATVQRYITGAAEAWHFISSPVAGQSISGSWMPSGTYGNGTGYDLYLWNEPTNCWIYKRNTTSVVNWNTVHPGGDFTPGRGYLYSVQAANPTKAFVGNLNNGSITYPLTFNSIDPVLKGFNLVGNPYPSSIDWEAATGWSRDGLVNSGGGYDMWIWNPAANNYGVFNSFTGTGTNSVTQYIAPMQGYFVRASAAGNLAMDNTIRVHNGAAWFKNTGMDPVKVSVVVQSDADSSFDEALLMFGYTANEPGATKLFSHILTAPGVYMTSGSENYSVQYLTDTAANPTVPVMFKPGKDGNYTLRCSFDTDKFDVVMLEDRQMHYSQDFITAKTYHFVASKNDDVNRFVLHFGPENNSSINKLPARIYTDGNRLMVDLSLVTTESEVFVYDALGRLLLHKTIQGLTKQELNINGSTQILLVQLTNKQGKLSRKLFYKN